MIKVEEDETIDSLFIVADKYGVEFLKNWCSLTMSMKQAEHRKRHSIPSARPSVLGKETRRESHLFYRSKQVRLLETPRI